MLYTRLKLAVEAPTGHAILHELKQLKRGIKMQLLLNWENLIFELPLGLGLLYLAVYTFSGWTFDQADADMSGLDHDMDAHLDVHGELAVDHDVDLSHDVDADPDSHSVESDASQSSVFMTSLNWIGIGRMPMSLVLMILLLTWGTLGFATMQLRQPVIVAIAIAGVGSLFITHFISALLTKTLFATLNLSRRRHELLGSMGEAGTKRGRS